MDGDGHFAADNRRLIKIVGPGAHAKVERTFAKPNEQDCWRQRLVANAFCVFGHLEQQGLHGARVAAVADTDRDIDAASFVHQRPVGQLLGQQHAVGNEYVGTLKGGERCGANPDISYFSGCAGKFDHITRLNGPFHHQDESADEIVDHRIEAEADADAQCANDDGQL